MHMNGKSILVDFNYTNRLQLILFNSIWASSASKDVNYHFNSCSFLVILS